MATNGKLKKTHLKAERTQARGYSRAVVTEGGNRMIWLAGETAVEAIASKKIAGDDFDAQAREVFARMDATLREVGATLADLVSMTVFITDARFGPRFLEIRRETLGDNFPASALITVAGLARPDLLVEIQSVAMTD
jgi:enamine deaminase RidA (YjgF/YER057c/UK114 family)